MPAEPSVRVRVPAKVNLHLSVGPLRPDGFHELRTVFHAVDLYDDVVATPASRLSLSVRGEAAGVPTDATNLAWQAVELLAASAGVEPNVHLELTKRIPVAGGMAGGSADAAGSLLACARLWGLDQVDLHPLAARLGSDVNFALVGGNARGSGRGEHIAPIGFTPELHWAFAIADSGISTRAAYAEFDRQHPDAVAPSYYVLEEMLRGLAAGDLRWIAAEMRNDLQPAALALRPELAGVLATGRRAGAIAGIVSGSGPTCAFLCESRAYACQVAAAFDCAVVAIGPAPGAAVVT